MCVCVCMSEGKLDGEDVYTMQKISSESVDTATQRAHSCCSLGIHGL